MCHLQHCTSSCTCQCTCCLTVTYNVFAMRMPACTCASFVRHLCSFDLAGVVPDPFEVIVVEVRNCSVSTA
jgi:hypothetical protein